jgi:hypothetical protein
VDIKTVGLPKHIMSSRLVHNKQGVARTLFVCFTCGVTWPCMQAQLDAIGMSRGIATRLKEGNSNGHG